MNYLVTSFVSILRFISDECVLCDESTKIGELFSEEFDDLDFELALCCFEATHRVAFSDKLWDLVPDDYDDLTIEEFVERFVEAAEQRDPLFVTKRFLMFKEAWENAIGQASDEEQE